MKKFLIFGMLAAACFSGCTKPAPEETENTGFVEVDPSVVAVSTDIPESTSDAVDPVAGLPVLQSESTATVQEAAPRQFEDVNMELKTWHTADNGIKIVRVPKVYKVPAGTSEVEDIESGTGLVSLSVSNGFLVFESEVTMDMQDSDNLRLFYEFPDGGKFEGLALAKEGKFYMIKNVMETVGLMKYYKNPVTFNFRTENGDYYSFAVTPKGLN